MVVRSLGPRQGSYCIGYLPIQLFFYVWLDYQVPTYVVKKTTGASDSDTMSIRRRSIVIFSSSFQIPELAQSKLIQYRCGQFYAEVVQSILRTSRPT